ncbi:MAG: HepT-like ribonuclease domain-containing protein [Bacteroidota bacterium]
MAEKPGDVERLGHVLKAINKILNYTEAKGFEDFLTNEMMQDAVIKNYEVIGEAIYHISKQLKEKYTHIEWKKIEGLRHVLVHDYYKVSPEILWQTKELYLEDLQVDIEEILLKES